MQLMCPPPPLFHLRKKTAKIVDSFMLNDSMLFSFTFETK